MNRMKCVSSILLSGVLSLALVGCSTGNQEQSQTVNTADTTESVVSGVSGVSEQADAWNDYLKNNESEGKILPYFIIYETDNKDSYYTNTYNYDIWVDLNDANESTGIDFAILNKDGSAIVRSENWRDTGYQSTVEYFGSYVHVIGNFGIVASDTITKNNRYSDYKSVWDKNNEFELRYKADNSGRSLGYRSYHGYFIKDTLYKIADSKLEDTDGGKQISGKIEMKNKKKNDSGGLKEAFDKANGSNENACTVIVALYDKDNNFINCKVCALELYEGKAEFVINNLSSNVDSYKFFVYAYDSVWVTGVSVDDWNPDANTIVDNQEYMTTF